MYYYIVDANRVSNREFERVQANLYSSISEYHISGEIVRVTGIRTVKQLVETAFFHQAKTIVAVGTDETVNEIVNIIGDREVVLGFIPLKTTELSETLGIPDVPQACKFLAIRRVAEMDLGVINDPPRSPRIRESEAGVDSSNDLSTRVEAGKYFLSKLSLGTQIQASGFDLLGLRAINNLSLAKSFEIKFKVDGNYQATAEILNAQIINTRGASSNTNIGNPTDEILDLLLLPKINKSTALLHRNHLLAGEYEKIPATSVIHFKQLEILAPSGLPIKIGDIELSQTPAKISIKPKAFKIIVGRDRKF